MPPPYFQEIGLRDRLLSIADPDIRAVRKRQIVRRRISQFQERGGHARLQLDSSEFQRVRRTFMEDGPLGNSPLKAPCRVSQPRLAVLTSDRCVPGGNASRVSQLVCRRLPVH